METGEKFKSIFTGKVYAVKAIGDRLVLLESDDKLSRVLTEKDYLRSFYQTVAYEDRPEVTACDTSLDSPDDLCEWTGSPAFTGVT